MRAVGAGASAIATAGAAGTPTRQHAHCGQWRPRRARLPGARSSGVRVQGDLVVATKSGFATVTFNRGFVESVNGSQLTIREGTKKATYKTVTLTIPAGAKVRDNGQSASLSQLTAGPARRGAAGTEPHVGDRAHAEVVRVIARTRKSRG